MNLQFWLKKFGSSLEELSLEEVYENRQGSTVLLVENQEEYDYMSGMCYLMGRELFINIVTETDPLELLKWGKHYANIILTYAPYDRNRI